MEFCTGCGHRLGVGRFCTNCGRPIAPGEAEATGPTGPSQGETAERPPVHVPTVPPPSSPPPPAYTQPRAPRYPLYVDEVAAAPPTESPPPARTPAAPSPDTRRPGPSLLAIALTVVILLLVAAIGGLLMFSGEDDDGASDPSPVNGTADGKSAPPSNNSPSGPTNVPSPADGAQDVARYSTATAPRTAKPNLDTQGNMVRYEARNMLDGVPETCWRTPGDGTDLEITFAFPEEVELSEVGLINGYAKSSGPLDWYAGNRKVLAVEWIFDDGTVVPQTFVEGREMQTIGIEPVTTTNVVLRLVSVSEPGSGPSARNYTAISDVRLVGAPS